MGKGLESRSGKVLAVALAAIVLTRCGGPSVLPSITHGGPETAVANASQVGRPPLPAGFPVPAGAQAIDLAADSGVIGQWSLNELGSAAYDFYQTALPRAGYRIVGLFPGDRAAIIRFNTPVGETWQLVSELNNGRTIITVRTDRP
jgi:hypothetical protein